MTPTAVIAVGGMLTAAGLVLVVATLRPAAPKLSTALAQLSASPLTSHAAVGPVRVAGRWGWLPTRVAGFVDAHVGVSDADLAILSMTRSQLAARKLTYGAFGLLAPSVFSVLLSLLGGQLPFVFPAALTLILTAGLWVSPSRDVKAKAQRVDAQACEGDRVLEGLRTRGSRDFHPKRSRPLWVPKLAEATPRLPLRVLLLLAHLFELGSGIEAGLPRLAGHNPNTLRPSGSWFEPNDVDVAGG